jgi:hypothetical protein
VTTTQETDVVQSEEAHRVGREESIPYTLYSIPYLMPSTRAFLPSALMPSCLPALMEVWPWVRYSPFCVCLWCLERCVIPLLQSLAPGSETVSILHFHLAFSFVGRYVVDPIAHSHAPVFPLPSLCIPTAL